MVTYAAHLSCSKAGYVPDDRATHMKALPADLRKWQQRSWKSGLCVDCLLGGQEHPETSKTTFYMRDIDSHPTTEAD